MKQTRVSPVSKKRKGGALARAAVRENVFARDGYRCVLDGKAAPDSCSGRLTFHHRRKASAGGAYVEENGLSLCEGHNGAVEDHPDLARLLYGDWLVVREGDDEWEQLGERFNRVGGA